MSHFLALFWTIVSTVIIAVKVSNDVMPEIWEPWVLVLALVLVCLLLICESKNK